MMFNILRCLGLNDFCLVLTWEIKSREAVRVECSIILHTSTAVTGRM